MIPAGLVWGRAGAVDGAVVAPAAAYGMAPAAAAAGAAQPLVYCYSPTAGASAADVTGVQLPASLTYHQQLQQQQQQMLLAAKTLQQQPAQQMYVQTALGLQPYQLPTASTSTALQLHAPIAMPYISPDQVYLPSSPSAAGVTSTSIGRKVRRLPCLCGWWTSLAV